ncbi:MAG: hypothetical protein AB1422_12995 [bacterium]
MEICCFPQSISTYFYKFQSISIILSPYHSYLLIPFLTLLIYSLNGYDFLAFFSKIHETPVYWRTCILRI